MVLGIIIGGVVFAQNLKNIASSKKVKIEDTALEIILDDYPSYSSDEDIETSYDRFLVNMISLEVENIAGISDCVINITKSNSGLSEADVCITVNNSFDDASKTVIQTYVSQALNISVENDKISY